FRGVHLPRGVPLAVRRRSGEGLSRCALLRPEERAAPSAAASGRASCRAALRDGLLAQRRTAKLCDIAFLAFDVALERELRRRASWAASPRGSGGAARAVPDLGQDRSSRASLRRPERWTERAS